MSKLVGWSYLWRLIGAAKKFLARVVPSIERFTNIAWHEKSACDVLIYDAVGSHALRHCIPIGTRVNVLRVREGLPLIKSANFFLLGFIDLCKYRNSGRAWRVALINTWKPKVVITFIDNSTSMGRIKSLFPDIQCVSIQNGCRWVLSMPIQTHLDLDHYFCYGELESDIMRQAGHTVEHYYPIGSIKAGIFWAEYPRKNKKFDLCYISHYRAQFLPVDGYMGEVLDAYKEAGKNVFTMVANVATKKNMTLCVAMKYSLGSAEYDQEIEFYAQSNNDEITFIPQSDYSSYELVQSSRITVNCCSALGYEALGLGERVIFAKDLKELAACVFKGSWKTNLATDRLPDLQRLYSTTDDEFSGKTELLLAMTDDEYLEYSAEAREYYMRFDENKLPQEVVKNKIAIWLGQSV
jgi:surface carbohydrate biosynthesis protein